MFPPLQRRRRRDRLGRRTGGDGDAHRGDTPWVPRWPSPSFVQPDHVVAFEAASTTETNGIEN